MGTQLCLPDGTGNRMGASMVCCCGGHTSGSCPHWGPLMIPRDTPVPPDKPQVLSCHGDGFS